MNELHYFLALNAELRDSFNYVEPDDKNFQCYGPKYASLLYNVSIEFESNAKALIKVKDTTAEVGDIGRIKGFLLSQFPRFESNEVLIERTRKKIRPFEGWGKQRLKWWSAYTDLKHNRVENYEVATLENVFAAMSALLVVIIYLERFRDKKAVISDAGMFYMDAMPQYRVTEGGKLPDEA